MRILLAEDDELLGVGLRAGLQQQGFEVDWVRDGQAALRELLALDYEAAVLDLGLPRLDGMEVLAALREQGRSLPVLVLTARDALMRNPGRILSREQLEAQIYSWGSEVASNAVEVHVSHLRRKLGANLIDTVRGLGYRIGSGTET